jgi:DNA-binding transcriptional ArsR family regulator/predicted O-methyltransferase YrrM
MDLPIDSRWQLYRLLSDPTRLRLLALAAEEELSVGELAELLGEPQPNVSRHAAPLRQAGLLDDRRQGTRTLVRLSSGAAGDPVVADALCTGRKLCSDDGSLGRIAEVVAHRDAKAREFFARPEPVAIELSPELPTYLFALASLIGRRELAVDAGTGDGVLLDLLAPLYRRVVGIDRSSAQLERARQRITAHGYDNVTLIEDQIGGERVAAAVGGGADLVVATRVLHHAPRPRATLQELVGLTRPGGKVLVVDYVRYDDERFQEQQADVWMGFSALELRSHAEAVGLVDVSVAELPAGFIRVGPDAHLGWQSLFGTRPAAA